MFDRREKQRIELSRRAVEIRREYWARKAWKFDFLTDFDDQGAGEYPERHAITGNLAR